MVGDRHTKYETRAGRWVVVERTWDPGSAADDASTDRDREIAVCARERDADTLLTALSGYGPPFEPGVWV